MNNSGSKKESVSRTYQGVDGYTPSATYLGSLGYCLELALRPGVQHSALETELNLESTLPMAAKLTALPLLFRADSGLCSLKIMQEITAQAAALSREIAVHHQMEPQACACRGDCRPARRVLRLTERTTCKHGNPLLLPAYELEGWRAHCPPGSRCKRSLICIKIMQHTSSFIRSSRLIWIWSACQAASLTPTS